MAKFKSLIKHYKVKIKLKYDTLTVDSSQLTFLPSSKSPDTKTRQNIKNSGRTKFRYCALV